MYLDTPLFYEMRKISIFEIAMICCNTLQFKQIAKPSKEEIENVSIRIMKEIEALREGAS